jgi:hypothetical protein
MKRAKNPTCEMRRAHFKMTATRRGGMPLPGSFFLGLARGPSGIAPAAADPPAVVVVVVVVVVDVDVDVDVDADAWADAAADEHPHALPDAHP